MNIRHHHPRSRASGDTKYPSWCGTLKEVEYCGLKIQLPSGRRYIATRPLRSDLLAGFVQIAIHDQNGAHCATVEMNPDDAESFRANFPGNEWL